jgi:hypothetical protein
MTNKLFDDFIKNKLYNIESEVPKDLFDKIINNKKDKPKAIWWFSTTFLAIAIATIVASGAIIYKNFYNNKLENSAASTINNVFAKEETNTANNINLVKILKPANEVQANNNSHANNNNLYNSLETKNELKIEALETNNFNKTEVKKQTNNSKINKTNFAESINSTHNKKQVEANVNKSFGNIANKNLSKKVNNKTANLLATSSSKNYFSTNVKTKSIGKKHANISEVSTVVLQENGNNIITKKLSIANANISIGNLGIAKVVEANANNIIDKKLLNFTSICPSANGKPRNDLYGEVYFAPDFTSKIITTSLPISQNYLDKKQNTEQSMVGFTIGARVSKNLGEHFLIKAGLQYTQANEKFTYRTENERKQTIVINIKTISRPGIGDTLISDTTVFTQIGYRTQSNVNTYKHFEIPITLAYEFGAKDSKFKYAINGGIIANITSWYEGRTIDTTFALTQIGLKENQGFYQHQFGISFYGAISIIRKINETIDVFAEPYYRYGVNNIKGKIGFNQWFNSTGIQFGVRIKLNKNKHL